MASIRKRGERYYIRYRDAAGVQHEVAAGTANKDKAVKLAGKMEEDLESAVRPRGRSLTVGQAWEVFERTVLPGKREATRIAYRSAMVANWLPAIGLLTLATLPQEKVRHALDGMPLAPSTKALRRNQLSGVYKWAIAEGYAYRNPCRGLDVAGREDPVPDTLGPRYLRLLVDHAPDKTRAAIMVLAYAGLRVGELRGLTWPEADTDTQTLYVNKCVYREGREAIAHHGHPFSKPKSGRGIRPVPIPTALASELKRWRKASSGHKNKWDLVFPNAWGGPLRADALGRYVREAALIVAALPEADPARREPGEEVLAPEALTPRTLRHAYARLMLFLGTSLPELQRLMGHAHYETTLRYARYETNERPYAVRALDAWGGIGKKGKTARFIKPDLDDRRKHALGAMDGRDVGDYPSGETRGETDE